VRIKLQKWLRFPSIGDRRANITKAHEATFRWILSPTEDSDLSSTPSIEDPGVSLTPSMQDSESPGSEFVEWLRNGSGVYWIQGKMGCGKSTLMKYVSEDKLTENHLLEWANGQTLHCPSYYFSKTGTSELQRSLQGLYRTLLATLIQHEDGLFRIAFPYWQASDSDHKPTAAVLRDALEKILTKSGITYRYCFFVDGLDEYQETDDTLRAELAKGLLELAQLPAIKLVVSSRPEAMFKLKFEHCPTMELHQLTQKDIAAYVDTEIRRRALPQVLASTETDELNSLCHAVIQKAEGVFLWVAIAVASILNGIADYETLPELKLRLGQLDPRLTVLFKQVLTERVQASHRKQVARSLLTQVRSYNHVFYYSRINLIVQAISPRVDAFHDYRPLLDNDYDIEAHVSDLQQRLPGRSCGLFSIPSSFDEFDGGGIWGNALNLLHSSLHEFLNEHETQTFLSTQAGDEFQVDEAIAVGQMASLVYKMNSEVIEQFSHHSYVVRSLIEIAHTIEMSESATGLTHTKLMSIFDELFGRDFQSCALRLDDLFKTDWDPLYDHYMTEVFFERADTIYSDYPLLRPRGISRHGSDLLSLTISFGLSFLLKYKMTTRRGVPLKTGTPLLFYPLCTSAKFRVWIGDSREEYFEEYNEGWRVTPVRLLLAQGADPNERCHGLTPWLVVLHRICSGRDDDFPLHRFGPPKKITSPMRSFLDKLEIAKSMLEHGADPFLRKETPSFTIYPLIFAELLGRECCRGNSLNDCECAHARIIQPQLIELVELVEDRRYLKQQMRTDGELMLIGAWLAAVLAYILQNVLT
jgi:hypothetical protein